MSKYMISVLSAFVITIVLCLVLSMEQIHAAENVGWKIFKDKNGLFTIKYPSNWSPSKYTEDSSAPLNVLFSYSGRGGSFAQLSLYGEESIYSNATEVVDSNYLYLQNEPNFKVLQETECGKYRINNMSACHVLITLKDVDNLGKPTIKNLVIGAIDGDGIEYNLDYYVTTNLYDIFLPVAQEMINSLNFTGVIPSSHNDQPTSNGLPELPPLT